MKEGKDSQLVERRDFMKKAGLASVGAVGAVAIGLSKTSAAAVPGTGAKPASSGYRETDHIRAYYATAKL